MLWDEKGGDFKRIWNWGEKSFLKNNLNPGPGSNAMSIEYHVTFGRSSWDLSKGVDYWRKWSLWPRSCLHFGEDWNSKVSFFFNETDNVFPQDFSFNLLTPKIWLSILPSSCYTFPFKLLQVFGVRSRKQLLPDMLEYSHYLFAG